jgi:dTMP kinase
LEGPDGAGKSTQAALLVERLRRLRREVIPVREPGGTDLGDSIRPLLVRREWAPIAPTTEALLFSACRAQLVVEIIRPALDRGATVVADRFSDSTIAYQGSGRGVDVDELRFLIRLATGGLQPDLTLLLDLPAEMGLERRGADGRQPHQSLLFDESVQMPLGWNRFEDEELAFHVRVREAYLRLAALEPSRWRVIDATQPTDAVSEAIWDAVLPGLATGSSSARP